MMALKMLLVRVDLASICFVLGVTEETVLAWLKRAVHQADAINRHLLRALACAPGATRRDVALQRAQARAGDGWGRNTFARR